MLPVTPSPRTYTVYGFAAPVSAMPQMLGYAGERLDSFTKLYFLGNGKRAYHSAIMRFSSPDSKSPFDIGGLNCYAYCGCDPVNKVDPSGHAGVFSWINSFKTSPTPTRPYLSKISNYYGERYMLRVGQASYEKSVKLASQERISSLTGGYPVTRIMERHLPTPDKNYVTDYENPQSKSISKAIELVKKHASNIVPVVLSHAELNDREQRYMQEIARNYKGHDSMLRVLEYRHQYVRHGVLDLE